MFLVETMLASALAATSPAPAVQVVAANTTATRTNHVAGLCLGVDEHAGDSEWAQNRSIGIEQVAGNYVYFQLNRRDIQFPKPSAVTVEKHPKYGVLDIGRPQSMSRPDDLSWRYTPKPGYTNVVDQATFLVDVQGIPVRVVAVFKVISPRPDSVPGPCKLGRWIISTETDTGTNNLPAWQTQSQLSALLASNIASATQSLTGFQALPGTTLGLTQGSGPSATITLDDNAAGYGWCIDPTPPGPHRRLPTHQRPQRMASQTRQRR